MLPVGLLLSAPLLEDHVKLWLVEQQTRLVAVISIPEKCDGCRDEAARWSALASEHRARGLRTIAVVGRSPMFGCVDPEWTADETLCDAMYDGFAKQYRLPERSSVGFLWNGKGRVIVSRGELAAMESAVKRQMATSLPRILLTEADDAPSVRASIAASNMYEPTSNRSLEALDRNSVPCARGQGLDADAVLTINRSNVALHSMEGCILAMVDRAPASQAIEAMLKAIRLRIEVQPLPQEADAPPQGMIADRTTPQGTLERSKAHLAGLRDPISKQLARAVEKHLGRNDIDGATFVRAVLRETLQVDVGGRLREQLASGEEVLFDLRDPRALRPGDLVFYVSYGHVPKVVVLYLGSGLIAEMADVRGVVVGPLPPELPWFFQVVARRPLTDAP